MVCLQYFCRNYNLLFYIVKPFVVEQYIAEMTVELDFFNGRQPKYIIVLSSNVNFFVL